MAISNTQPGLAAVITALIEQIKDGAVAERLDLLAATDHTVGADGLEDLVQICKPNGRGFSAPALWSNNSTISALSQEASEALAATILSRSDDPDEAMPNFDQGLMKVCMAALEQCAPDRIDDEMYTALGQSRNTTLPS